VPLGSSPEPAIGARIGEVGDVLEVAAGSVVAALILAGAVWLKWYNLTSPKKPKE